jgi:hypothetical protein
VNKTKSQPRENFTRLFIIVFISSGCTKSFFEFNSKILFVSRVKQTVIKARETVVKIWRFFCFAALNIVLFVINSFRETWSLFRSLRSNPPTSTTEAKKQDRTKKK